MKQKDALLAGAKRCLVEKGYGRTTARDIAEASAAHLGSIGYHYGSKDRLMNMAALELSSDWGDAIEKTVRESPGSSPRERLAVALDAFEELLPASRDLQSASLQALVQAQFDDELREQFARGGVESRTELAAMLAGRSPGDAEGLSDAETAVGFLLHALTIGMVSQFLLDPESVPDAQQMAGAFDLLAGDGPARGEGDAAGTVAGSN